MKKLLLLICVCAGLFGASEVAQDDKATNFSSKLKQYEQAKANTAFIQKAIASAKPAKEFLNAELKASFESLDDYVKEVLNEPLGNGNIVGALFFNGLAGITNYFGLNIHIIIITNLANLVAKDYFSTHFVLK